MNQNRHWVIYSSGLSRKSLFIEKLIKGVAPEVLKELKGKKGALFSIFTLEKFIKEEAVHDNFALSHNRHRSIRTFSSGEQKKALLDYLVSGQPDFFVLDNAFDMLDREAQNDLLYQLTELSKKIPVLQIFKRKNNLLPFIKNAIRVEDEKVLFAGTVAEYYQHFNENEVFSMSGAVPLPMEKYEIIRSPLIRFNKVYVDYGERTILKNISWEINQGDFWQLMGPNGSGKTTLLTMITGDNPKAYGQDIMLFGKKKGSGESIWDIKKKIGYVTPSMTTLFNGRHTVEKMVISGLVDSIGLYQKPTNMQKLLAGEWIDLIGLTKEKFTPFANLTEGQQCMVLIVRSMIKHPPLLILDEPTHGLNDYSVSIVAALVNKLAQETQTTIIYVSHRNEPGLKPTSVFELMPSKMGSEGRVNNTFYQ